MANINDLFPSKFLKAHELQGHTPTVTIERVGVEQVRNRIKTDTKAVLYFTGKSKGMLLNKTNAQTVTEIAGSPLTERWAGVAITLYATTATFDKTTHDVIRIKAPITATSPRPRVSDVADTRRPLPPIFTDELEIDLQDGGRR
jgi:hypothetical protein